MARCVQLSSGEKLLNSSSNFRAHKFGLLVGWVLTESFKREIELYMFLMSSFSILEKFFSLLGLPSFSEVRGLHWNMTKLSVVL